jgi:hypothetical protein
MQPACTSNSTDMFERYSPPPAYSSQKNSYHRIPKATTLTTACTNQKHKPVFRSATEAQPGTARPRRSVRHICPLCSVLDCGNSKRRPQHTTATAYDGHSIRRPQHTAPTALRPQHTTLTATTTTSYCAHRILRPHHTAPQHTTPTAHYTTAHCAHRTLLSPHTAPTACCAPPQALVTSIQ